ncbi:MAG: hypothetical protein WC823_01080 [Parcubacteria group bacterium]|jgi:hypothetical protein
MKKQKGYKGDGNLMVCKIFYMDIVNVCNYFGTDMAIIGSDYIKCIFSKEEILKLSLTDACNVFGLGDETWFVDLEEAGINTIGDLIEIDRISIISVIGHKDAGYLLRELRFKFGLSVGLKRK